MGHPRRISFPEALYHISSRGNNCENIFVDNLDKLRYLKILKKYKDRFHFYIYAYCLMSNHIHLLLRTKEGNISKIMHSINTSYTVYFNKKNNRKGHLFQGRYHSIIVDKEEYLLALIRYIHLNPVRARIVQFAQEYFWSSYREYLSNLKLDKSIITDTDFVLEYFGRNKLEQIKNFRDFISREMEGNLADKSPFEAIKASQFLGSDKFVKEIMRIDSCLNLRINGRNRKIIETMMKYFGEGRYEIIKRSKKHRDIDHRDLMIYIVKLFGDMTMKEIGLEFGGINISSVSRGIRRAEKLVSSDEKICKLFSEITAGIS